MNKNKIISQLKFLTGKKLYFLRQKVIKKYKKDFPELWENSSDYMRLYAWMYNLSKEDLTCFCGKPVIFDDRRFTAKQFCSKYCSDHSPTRSERMKAVWAERNPQEVEEITKNGLCKTNTSESRKKAQDTCLQRYDVKFAMQSELMKEKQTNLRKYGVENAAQTYSARKKYLEKNFERFQEIIKANGYKYMGTEEEYLDPTCTKLKYKCLHCKRLFYVEAKSAYLIKCAHCAREFSPFRSYGEKTLFNFVAGIGKRHGIEVEANRKKYVKGYEIDVYIPKLKVGIEYCGLYWHSNLHKKDTYHFDKFKAARDAGIRLIQIFENEWACKRTRLIIKSMIKGLFGELKERIYARKCEVHEVSSEKYKDFLEKNHIQGFTPAQYRLGLFTKDKDERLVAVLGIGKSRFSGKEDWEVIRFCTKRNHAVLGGLSKLIKHFVGSHKGSLISYIDCRYFTGYGYAKCGFKEVGLSRPNYFYFKFRNRDFVGLESRQKYQKHKLAGKLACFNPHLSERENMIMNDYLYIHDAGNLKMIYSDV